VYFADNEIKDGTFYIGAEKIYASVIIPCEK